MFLHKDISQDKMLSEILPDITRRIDTERFGPFVFEPGIVIADITLALQRVEDAHDRFVASPLAQVANRLEKEVVVSSVFSTNTIEGGMLSEDETAGALALDPALVQEVEQRRALNIKAAYDLSQAAAAKPGWSLDVPFIIDVHRLITDRIPHADNRPGVLRDNPKARVTYVGDAAHGGRYKPPQFGRDIEILLQALVEWHAELAAADVNTLHDRVNRLVGMLLYASNIRRALDGKEINVRQYTILSQLLDRGRPVALEEMRHAPWYLSLYLKRNDKTRQRDLRGLRDLELLYLDTDDALWPGFIVPQRIKPPGKRAS